MAGNDRGTRTNVPSSYDRFMASNLLANDYIGTINRALELTTELNRFHAEMNDFMIKKLKPPADVDLSVLTFAIGLTYTIQIMTWLLSPLCPRALVAFLQKYQNTLKHVMVYLQSGNVNEANTKKYLQMLLDRHQELNHIVSGCLGLPVEIGLIQEPEG